MGGLCSPAGAPKGGRSSPSVTNERSGTPSNPDGAGHTFPKSSRILRPGDFRKVYQNGFRISGPYFAAFCLADSGSDGPRLGFTTPRALGKSVLRNRMKRRLREAARLNLHQLPPGWSVVFNPRKGTLEAAFPDLVREVERVFQRCKS